MARSAGCFGKSTAPLTVDVRGILEVDPQYSVCCKGENEDIVGDLASDEFRCDVEVELDAFNVEHRQRVSCAGSSLRCEKVIVRIERHCATQTRAFNPSCLSMRHVKHHGRERSYGGGWPGRASAPLADDEPLDVT